MCAENHYYLIIYYSMDGNKWKSDENIQSFIRWKSIKSSQCWSDIILWPPAWECHFDSTNHIFFLSKKYPWTWILVKNAWWEACKYIYRTDKIIDWEKHEEWLREWLGRNNPKSTVVRTIVTSDTGINRVLCMCDVCWCCDCKWKFNELPPFLPPSLSPCL